MWLVAKALNISPFSEEVSHLTTSQVTWILSNYYQDKEEQYTQFKTLCAFINPEAAHKVFSPTPTTSEELTEVDDVVFLDQIRQHTTEAVSNDELRERLMHPEAYENIDTIESV